MDLWMAVFLAFTDVNNFLTLTSNTPMILRWSRGWSAGPSKIGIRECPLLIIFVIVLRSSIVSMDSIKTSCIFVMAWITLFSWRSNAPCKIVTASVVRSPPFSWEVACRAISSLSSKRESYNVSKTLWLKLRQDEKIIQPALRYRTPCWDPRSKSKTFAIGQATMNKT